MRVPCRPSAIPVREIRTLSIRLELFFVDRADLASRVEAAMRTDAMRRLRLVALGTEVGRGRLQRGVRAALCRACPRVSASWIWHDRLTELFHFIALSAASCGSSQTCSHSHVPMWMV